MIPYGVAGKMATSTHNHIHMSSDLEAVEI